MSASPSPQCVSERASPPALSPSPSPQISGSSPHEPKHATIQSPLESSPASRTPLPPFPPRPVRKRTKKTENEKRRGESLNGGNKGIPAERPCGRCQRLNKTCWVAQYPSEFNSFKCGTCIWGKCACTFNHSNPGIDYGPEVLGSNLKREEGKKASRKKASDTRQKRSAAKILLSMKTPKA